MSRLLYTISFVLTLLIANCGLTVTPKPLHVIHEGTVTGVIKLDPQLYSLIVSDCTQLYPNPLDVNKCIGDRLYEFTKHFQSQ